MNQNGRKFLYKVYTMYDGSLHMVKEYEEAYQMDPDTWKPTPEQAIAYYEETMIKHIRNAVAVLKEALNTTEKDVI